MLSIMEMSFEFVIVSEFRMTMREVLGQGVLKCGDRASAYR